MKEAILISNPDGSVRTVEVTDAQLAQYREIANNGRSARFLDRRVLKSLIKLCLVEAVTTYRVVGVADDGEPFRVGDVVTWGTEMWAHRVIGVLPDALLVDASNGGYGSKLRVSIAGDCPKITNRQPGRLTDKTKGKT